MLRVFLKLRLKLLDYFFHDIREDYVGESKFRPIVATE